MASPVRGALQGPKKDKVKRVACMALATSLQSGSLTQNASVENLGNEAGRNSTCKGVTSTTL